MKHYKTLLFDFDGTLLDTSVMHQYKEIKNRPGVTPKNGHKT